GELLRADPLHLGAWVKALEPGREALLKPLETIFRDPQRGDQKQVAAQVLAAYAAGQPGLLAELLLSADARQYAVLLPALQRHREPAVARMRNELRAVPNYWKDRAGKGLWKAPAGGLRREVEQAGGLFAPAFALCQALPLERLQTVTEGLRPA